MVVLACIHTHTNILDPSLALMSSEAARIRQQELSTLRSELFEERERTSILQRLVEEGEEDRRRMHNTIQDLRGSVRVYVRARPFLKSDGEEASDHVRLVIVCVMGGKVRRGGHHGRPLKSGCQLEDYFFWLLLFVWSFFSHARHRAREFQSSRFCFRPPVRPSPSPCTPLHSCFLSFFAVSECDILTKYTIR